MDSDVLTPDDVHWIATILLDDAEAVEGRERIYHALGLRPSEIQDIRIQVTVYGTGTYGFFWSTLSKWISTPGRSLTNLVSILNRESFPLSASEILSKKDVMRASIAEAKAMYEQMAQAQTNNLEQLNIEDETPTGKKTKLENSIIRLRSHDSDFIGRESDLKKLHKFLTRNEGFESSASVHEQMTLLTGIDGTGKTSLAEAYAEKYSEYFDNSVHFFNSESSLTMEMSFKEIASRANVTKKGIAPLRRPLEEITKDTYKHYTGTRSLFVFDNVEDYARIVIPYLPKDLERGEKMPSILIISKNPKLLQNLKIETLQLDGGGSWKDEAMFLIQRSVDIKWDENGEDLKFAETLCSRLHYNPLFLEQSIAYIVKHSKTLFGNPIEEYLKLYDAEFAKVSELNPKIKDANELTQLTILSLAIGQIANANKSAVVMLSQIAYLEPDNIIVPEAAKDFRWPSRFNEKSREIKLLSQYGLLKGSDDNKRVHRLTQRMLRVINENNDNVEEILSKLSYTNSELFWNYLIEHEYDDLLIKFGPKRKLYRGGFLELLIENLCASLGSTHKTTIEVEINGILARKRWFDPNLDECLKITQSLISFCETNHSDSSSAHTAFCQLRDRINDVGNFLFTLGKNYKKSEFIERALRLYRALYRHFPYENDTDMSICKCFLALDQFNELVKFSKKMTVCQERCRVGVEGWNDCHDCLDRNMKIARKLLSLECKAPAVLQEILRIGQLTEKRLREQLNGFATIDMLNCLREVVRSCLRLGPKKLQDALAKCQEMFEIVRSVESQQYGKLYGPFLEFILEIGLELHQFGQGAESMKYLKFVEKTISTDMYSGLASEYSDEMMQKARKAIRSMEKGQRQGKV